MPFNPANASPGVYVFEAPSGVHTITGVATSITAFVGRAPRGPANATMITSYADYVRTFGGQWSDSTLGDAVNDFFLNGGSQAIIVRVYAPPAVSSSSSSSSSSKSSSASSGSSPNADGVATLTVGGLGLVASSPGLWGNNLSATTDLNTKDTTNSALFNLVVSETGGSSERFLNLSTDPKDPNYAPFALKQNSALVAVAQDSNGKWKVPSAVTVATATASGGDDGGSIGSTQLIGNTNVANKTGLYALDNVDLFNILYIPPYLATGDVDTAVIGDAAAYCETRRAFLIVDPPVAWTSVNAAQTSFLGTTDTLGTRSDHAAIYFPRVKRAGQAVSAAPGGIIAGVFARTDANRGVWKAPAGVDAVLTGVVQMDVLMNDTENGQLNSLGINCLRSFPVIGRIVWGARTLSGADRLGSEYKYIPVRRTALYLEESLYRGLQWVVFEPNDEPLWAQIRLNVGAFMQTLFRQGAFQGATPRDAYFVKCDKETTTQNDIDNGIVNIVVGFAPLKPAEFVVVTIQQLAGQLQV